MPSLGPARTFECLTFGISEIRERVRRQGTGGGRGPVNLGTSSFVMSEDVLRGARWGECWREGA